MNNRRHRNPAALSSIFVETSQAKYAFTRINELMEDGWQEDYCMGLLLLGPNRAGKTRLVRHFIEAWLGDRYKDRSVPPIVWVEVPPGCSLKSFATEVLRALHDPAPEYAPQPDRTSRIAAAVQRHDVQLLVIDEIQRLIDADTDKIKETVAIWVSGLLNRRICPLLLVGEEKASKVFANQKHLEGRVLGQVDVLPFDWADRDQRREFAAILYHIDAQLGLDDLSDLGSLRTAQRIHEFSEGLLGQAARLIGQARTIARRLGRPKITDDVLAQAVDELRVGAGRKVPNPFRSKEAA